MEETCQDCPSDDGMWDVTDDNFADLRLFPGSTNIQKSAARSPGWDSLEQMFEQATGFALQASEATSTHPTENLDAANPHAENAAGKLAAALREMAEQRGAALDALRQSEAELATAIPVVLGRDRSDELVRRLETVLRDAAGMLRCFAGAVYMLDDDTSQLKLRAGWGLPNQRLVEAARPLRGAISDLEAMLGHIVLLDDTSTLPHWRSPEQAAAAACVPLSSSSTPLGTLWFFADEPRGFTEDDGRLLEIVAGRIVAELEREAVSRERTMSRQVDTQLGRARQWQDNRLPSVAPPIPGWEIAAWSAQSERVGGDFHGWRVLPDNSLAVWLGHAQGGMLESALSAASLQGALSICLKQAGFESGVARTLEDLNQSLWTCSAGDQMASLGFAVVDPASGRMRFASTGETGASLIRTEGAVSLPPRRDPLGLRPETAFPETGVTLERGDVLLLVSDGVTQVQNRDGQPFDATTLTSVLREHRNLSAHQLVDHARLMLQADDRKWTAQDCTIVVLRRDEA